MQKHVGGNIKPNQNRRCTRAHVVKQIMGKLRNTKWGPIPKLVFKHQSPNQYGWRYQYPRTSIPDSIYCMKFCKSSHLFFNIYLIASPVSVQFPDCPSPISAIPLAPLALHLPGWVTCFGIGPHPIPQLSHYSFYNIFPIASLCWFRFLVAPNLFLQFVSHMFYCRILIAPTSAIIL